MTDQIYFAKVKQAKLLSQKVKTKKKRVFKGCRLIKELKNLNICTT